MIKSQRIQGYGQSRQNVISGNAFGVDHEFLAKELGFDGVSSNFLDATCDRDFVVEFLMWSTLMLTHLSQMAEDSIITDVLKGVTIKLCEYHGRGRFGIWFQKQSFIA